MANLAHTQYRWIELIFHSAIWLADFYSIILLMFGAACLARMLPVDGRPRTWWPLAPLAVALLPRWRTVIGKRTFASPGPRWR